jgi:hypothetical protein
MNLVSIRKTSYHSSKFPSHKISPPKDLESSSKADSFRVTHPDNRGEVTASRYEYIATITSQENTNLKHQNAYLLDKLRRMTQREQKIKKLYNKAIRYKLIYE